MCAFGSLEFYQTGTLVPKDVFNDPGLTVNLGNVLTLDAAARPEDGDVWLDDDLAYTVILKDGDGAEVWARDDVRAGDVSASPAIPDPSATPDGYVLGVVAGLYALFELIGLPDPTGFPNGYLATDGTLWFPATFPAAAVYDEDDLPGGIDQTSTSFKIGKLLVQFGSDTAPSAGAQVTTKSVTFPTAYTGSLLHVDVTPSVGAVTGESGGVESHAPGRSNAGFTATFYAPDMGAVSGSENIVSPVAFTWVSYGLMA